MQLVQWQWERPEAFGRLGVRPSGGVLLHGPSGCGKTMLAQVLAAECHANFVEVRLVDLMSKYLGEAEQTLRRLFANARAASPTIMFFDELDAFAIKRDLSGGADGAAGVFGRILSTLLNELDGVESSNDGLVVLAATNRPDSLDAALTRPGRLEHDLLIGHPGRADRAGVLRVHTQRMPLQGVDIDVLADRTAGWSCAELAHLCKEAAFAALREDMDGCDSVSQAHFDVALASLASGTGGGGAQHNPGTIS